MSLIAPYLRVLRHPGALRFSSAAFLARIPISMVGLGIVLLVSAVRGSYGVAGFVAAGYTVSAAFLNPVGSRLVDRWGQRRIVTASVAIHSTSLILLVVAVMQWWPLALTFLLACLTGATQPATGALVRARWAVALGDHPNLRTAFAFESVLDELIFIIGPALATFLAVAVGAPAPLVISAAFVTLGCLLLLAQRSTEPPVVVRSGGRSQSLLRRRGMLVVVTTLVAIGAVFGSIDVVVVAAADAESRRGAAGVVLAVYALGSMVSALIIGARSHTRRDDALPRMLLLSTIALAVVTVPFLVINGVVAIGFMTLLAGLTVSPVLITSFALVERIAPHDRLTEGLTWATSGIALGVAMSAALSGALIDRGGSQAGFFVTVAAGALTLVSAFLGRGVLARDIAARVGGPDSPAAGDTAEWGPGQEGVEHG